MSLCQSISEVYPPKPKFTEKNVASLLGNVYLITGGTSGIGFSLAKILYSKHAKVYITSRTLSSGSKALQELKSAVPESHGELECLTVDLSDLSQIAPAMKLFLEKESKLNAVWYNAGVMNVPKGSRTKQGYELQWGTNVVAHFVMNKLLMPILLETAKTAPKGSVRSVWVSSDGHVNMSPKPDGVDWENLKTQKEGELEDMGQMKYYGQSKAGDVLLAKEVAARFGKEGIIGVSLNPGHLKSNLTRDTSKFQAKVADVLFLHDPYLGALTELYAGLSSDIGLENNGAYVIPWGRLGESRADIEAGFKERGTGEKLWDILEKETKEFL